MLAALKQLAGDFALAVLDPAAGRLWLARDRFGVRPLYWTAGRGGVAFASQPRSLLMLPGVATEPDPSFVARFAASHYRTFDNDPEASPYRDIRQLPAGHALEIGAARPRLAGALLAARGSGDFDEPAAELAEGYRAHLLRAVRQRLGAAARPVFTLSGGLDSSSVLCAAVAVTGEPQQAVSCVYTDTVYDEREEIRDVVATKVAQWHAVEIGNDIDVAGDRGAQVRAARRAGGDRDVAVASAACRADGGRLRDAVRRPRRRRAERRRVRVLPDPLRRSARGRGAKRRSRRDRLLGAASRPSDPSQGCRRRRRDDGAPDRSRGAGPVPCPTARACCATPPALGPASSTLRAFEPVMDSPFPSYLKNRTFQDMFRETLPCCLRAEDRHGAAFGIETIDPFLDHELVEFMFRVPARSRSATASPSSCCARRSRASCPRRRARA